MKRHTTRLVLRVVICALLGAVLGLLLVSIAYAQVAGVGDLTEGRTAEYMAGAIGGLIFGGSAGYKVGADRYKKDAESHREMMAEALRERMRGG